MPRTLEIRRTLEQTYPDVLTPEALRALEALAHFDAERRTVMTARIARRAARARDRQRIAFLDPAATIARTNLTVEQARDGRVRGQRDSARSAAAMDSGHRPGGAAGRVHRDEPPQRRLRAAVGRRRLDVRRRGRARPGLDDVARQPAQPEAGDPSRRGLPEGRRAGRRRDEPVGAGASSAATIIDDWQEQLDFTTKIFRARGLHLDDRHVRHADGAASPPRSSTRRSTSSTTTRRSREAGASIVLYLPKIQTAEEAALWNDILSALEAHLGLPHGTIKVYVLVEQVEACFQLMEIRAALGRTSSASTPAAGTTSTACPTRWRGIRRSSIRTSTRSR